ncbi:hypothetical protein pipiens_011461 [Culex pipiens pipiens]|uniref:PHD-type domain-containing protein n=1 Tax=Culex pipiens pipiens TaxID=38569 RepID=A0ABD1D678_CULPP
MAAATANTSKNTILCHACTEDVKDEYVSCQGFCNAVFHLHCSSAKPELLKEIASHRQIFWLCRSCSSLMMDLRHRRSVQSAYEAGQELSLSHHNRIVEQLKSELLSELKTELSANFAKLIASNSLTPKSASHGAGGFRGPGSRRLFNNPAPPLRPHPMPPQHDTGKPKETADVVEGVVAEGYGTATEEEVPRFWLYLSRVSRNVTEAQIAKLAVDRLGVVDVKVKRLVAKGKDVSRMRFISFKNVRGLRTKTNQLHLSLSSCDYDVIAFSETWLNAKIVDSELSSDYTFYRADRSRETSVLERGGGVLIGVKKRFHPEPIHLRGGEKLEQIAVRIPLPGKTLFVCCVYIPPNSDATIYTQHSSCVQQLCDLAQGPDEVIVVGDYNVPNLSWHFDEDINGYLPSGQSTEQEVALIEDVLGTGLQQMFDLPNANGRLLDLALVSDSSRFQLIEPPRAILKVDAHHRPFILVLDMQSTGTAAEQAGTYYDFANCDTTALNNSIASLDWANLLLVGSVDDIVERFYDKLNEIIREVVPLKHRRPHPNSHQPWWNRETRNLRNRLRKARKRFLKHPTEMLGRELADRELHYEMSLEAAFRGYISGIESNLKREPKSFWAFVKKRKQDKGIPQDMVYRDSSASTPDDSVQLFADFFKTVYSANQPTPSNESLDKILPHELHMPLVCLTEEDVRKVLASTDASKGPGPDCIPPSIVKQCAATLANPLAIIFNRSLESGVFPAKWKVASITPIHKSGNVHNVENYRSISILSCLPKVFEKIVHEFLSHAVQPIISACQHGFMAKRSTTTNLMTFVTDVLRTAGYKE